MSDIRGEQIPTAPGCYQLSSLAQTRTKYAITYFCDVRCTRVASKNVIQATQSKSRDEETKWKRNRRKSAKYKERKNNTDLSFSCFPTIPCPSQHRYCNLPCMRPLTACKPLETHSNDASQLEISRCPWLSGKVPALRSESPTKTPGRRISTGGNSVSHS